MTENHGVAGSNPALATSPPALPRADALPGTPMDSTPRVIRKSDPTKVEIEWQDGARTVYSAKALRDLCPCAYCVDEHTGVQVHDPATVPDALTTKDVRLVGHYAIAVQFSDGHGTGIYPFSYLRAGRRAGRPAAS